MIIEIITNYNCNLKCYYCFQTNKFKKQKEYTELKDIKKFFKDNDNFKKEKEIEFNIYGGESFLKFIKLKKLLTFINNFKNKNKEKKIKIILITNGTIMNKKIINYFFRKKIFVIFSYESDSNIQKKIRKKDTLKNIKKFSKKNKVYIQTVLNKENIKNMKNHLKFLEEHKNFRFNYLTMFDENLKSLKKEDYNNINLLLEYFSEKIKKEDDKHLGKNIFNSFFKRYFQEKKIFNCYNKKNFLIKKEEKNCSLKIFNKNEENLFCFNCKKKCYYNSCPTFNYNSSICDFNVFFTESTINYLKEIYENKKYTLL